MEKDVKGLVKTVDVMAKNVAKVLERIDKLKTKVGKIETTVSETRKEFKFETYKNFNDIQIDIKSFKKETQDNFTEVNEKLDDLSDTSRNYDKRIERLEVKTI